MTGKAPFNYIGIVHVDDMDEFNRKGKTTQEFQDLMAKLAPMLKDSHILYGEEIY